MDLPTYTNIWRIEKRLYKLYDFRLPAPLPINWIAVFTGITVPYIVLLVAIGLPFNHTLVWLYVLPPGVLTWLTTRPVIESKRLPELLESQVRYLTEPRVWCRLAPLSEKDQIVVTARVWHSRRVPQRRKAGAGIVALRERGAVARRNRAAAPPVSPEVTVIPARGPAPVRQAAVAAPAGGQADAVWPGQPSVARPGLPVTFAAPPIEVAHTGPAPRPVPSAGRPAVPPAPVPEAVNPSESDEAPVTAVARLQETRKAQGAGEVQPLPTAQQDVRAPVVKAVAGTRGDLRVPSIERALSGPSRDRNLSWHGKVRIVTGAGAAPGPGTRDQEALDRARARLPLRTPMRVLMLGCTSGAGQTVTTLMTGHILASLREHPVAAVDLHDGTLARYSAPVAWLEEIFRGKAPRQHTPVRPDGLHPTPKPTPARLDVIACHDPLRDGDEIKLAVQLSRHYPLTMLDPGATGLTKLLKITDQLVVVVPASVEAASALADTRDWLDAHGFADLAAHSVTLVNGVSRRSLTDVEHAESVARGRCRAIVRVPWDDMLPVEVTGPSTLRPQTRVAYTALAGVLVAGMAAAPVRTSQ